MIDLALEDECILSNACVVKCSGSKQGGGVIVSVVEKEGIPRVSELLKGNDSEHMMGISCITFNSSILLS